MAVSVDRKLLKFFISEPSLACSGELKCIFFDDAAFASSNAVSADKARVLKAIVIVEVMRLLELR